MLAVLSCVTLLIALKLVDIQMGIGIYYWDIFPLRE